MLPFQTVLCAIDFASGPSGHWSTRPTSPSALTRVSTCSTSRRWSALACDDASRSFEDRTAAFVDRVLGA